VTNPARFLGSISGLRLRATTAALAVGLLTPAVVAAQSGHEPAYSLKVLYDFCSLTNCTDGELPSAGLISDAQSNLYGTTLYNVFRLTTAGKETVLYTFTGGTDGGFSTASLVRDSAGNLYGTTQSGGDLSCNAPYGCGTVFKVDSAGHETVLHSFAGGKDGMRPCAGLTRDSAGNFYGTTALGGRSYCGFAGEGCGTVFKLDSAGNETVLYAFRGGADGGIPEGNLILDAKGNLYGTTYGNGTTLPGTVFKLPQKGKETVLHGFRGGKDGENPAAGLIMDASGNLYGTTSGIGGGSLGTVFKLSPSRKETVLWTFKGPPDGATPFASLIQDAMGNLHGTTYIGGDAGCSDGQGAGCGTVFEVTNNGKETVLYKFKGSDGLNPLAGLLQDKQGNLYGTTEYGGHSTACPLYYGCGVVFKLTPK